MTSDNRLVVCLVGLAVWILLSSLDDLFIALVAIFPKGERRCRWPTEAEIARVPERRIAILVPLWEEAARHRADAGTQPGRHPVRPITISSPARIGTTRSPWQRSPRLPAALPAYTSPWCRTSGPTSKGDCLNAIFDCLIEYEAAHGVRYEVIVTHDAEDLVAPESLRLINWFSRDYQMVQIPVLPLPTGLAEMTHGVYCDEFAEYQQKDIPARQRLGGFLPS